MNWIRVDDSLPPPGLEVLIARIGLFGTPRIDKAKLQAGRWVHSEDYETLIGVEYWCELVYPDEFVS